MSEPKVKSPSKEKPRKKLSASDLELKKENKAIASIGPKWKERKSPLHVALESLDIDFNWEEAQVLKVISQVEEGKDLAEMMDYFERPANDIRVLIFELALTEQINTLPKGF